LGNAWLAHIIERNTPVPTRRSGTFYTYTDSHLSGKRACTKNNNLPDRFALSGIPPAPRALPQIEVTFGINANGISNVSAFDKTLGKSSRFTITNDEGCHSREIERMVRKPRNTQCKTARYA
jgi:molecular chaperone DnaK (HSP70)